MGETRGPSTSTLRSNPLAASNSITSQASIPPAANPITTRSGGRKSSSVPNLATSAHSQVAQPRSCSVSERNVRICCLGSATQIQGIALGRGSAASLVASSGLWSSMAPLSNLRVAPMLERWQFSNVKFSAGHSQIFQYHQLLLDELVKNFLTYPETSSSLRKRSDHGPQAVIRNLGSAPPTTTQVHRPVATLPVPTMCRLAC